MTTSREQIVGEQPAAEQRAEGRRDRRRGWLPLGVAVTALLGFTLVMILVLLGDTKAFDIRMTFGIQRLDWPWLLGLMRAVSWFGFQPQATLIGIALIAGFFLAGRRLESAFTVIALALGSLNEVLKLIFHRPRPSAAIDGVIVREGARGTSFPSGHVLTYTIVCGYLAYLIYTQVRQPARRRALLVLPLTLIVLVGPSRVYLGQHWFTDVTASYLLGSAALVGLLAAYRRAKARQLSHTLPQAKSISG